MKFRIKIEEGLNKTNYSLRFCGTTLLAHKNETYHGFMVIKNYKSVRLISRLHLFNNHITTELRKLNM